MRPGTALRYALRESRGSRGRLAFFVLCLAVGVTAVVAVAGLVDAVETALRLEARQLLAADLAISGRRPIPEAVEVRLAGRPELAVARIKELATVAAVPDGAGGVSASQLVELKAVDGAYPFYGRLELEPDRPLAELLAADRVLVAPDLLGRLGLAPGGTLALGGERFTVAGVVRSEPDGVVDAFRLGPRVMLSFAGLERAGLERFGSRVRHRLLLRLPPGADRRRLAALAEEIEPLLADERYRLETAAEAQPALRDGLRRAERYLGLVALLSLVLGGLGVAQTTRAWLAGRLDAMAILRALGLTPGEVFGIYLAQAAVLGLAGSLAGLAGGTLLLARAPAVLGDLLPAAASIDPYQPRALLRGLALGLGIALAFSLPPLLAVRRVPPLRVLRREIEPLPASRALRLASLAAVGLAVLAAAAAQSGSAGLGWRFTLGLALAAGLLAAAARLLVAGLGALPRLSAPFWLRQGLAAMARPGAGTLGAVVALGLGVLLLVGLTMVERGLAAELDPELGGEAPTAFLIDVQTDQWPGVERLLNDSGASAVRSVPVVTARLARVGGRSTRDLASEAGDRGERWALSREQRLTYLDQLPEDNRIAAGAWWSDAERLEVSVERDFARDLGVGLGETLTFDIQGVPLDLVVTSLREVDWRTFGINFFLVAEPEALAEAPQTRLATARLPAGSEVEIQNRLAAGYPNVTLLDTRSILEKVRGILARVTSGVRFLGGFTALVGIVILAGAVSAGLVRRGREVALLKTLGTTRAGVVAALAVELALAGVVAGVVGTLGGAVLARAVLVRGMEIAWRPEPAVALVALAMTIALTALTGLAALLPALQRRPAEVLRSD